jgi:hypothetical protein
MLTKTELLIVGGALAALTASVLFMKRPTVDRPPNYAEDVLAANSRETSRNGTGAVRIYKVSDYECPACQSALKALNTGYEPVADTVWHVIPYPLPRHATAYKLAVLGEIAKERGVFADFHKSIEMSPMENPEVVDLAIVQWQTALGVFPFDYGKYERATESIEKITKSLQIDAIPSFYVFGHGKPFATHNVAELMQFLGAKTKTVQVATGTCGPNCP